jgi:hypothetical protein
LCRRGRSVLVLTLVFGLVTASIIPASTLLAFSPTVRLRIQSPGLPWNRLFYDGFLAAATRYADRR